MSKFPALLFPINCNYVLKKKKKAPEVLGYEQNQFNVH